MGNFDDNRGALSDAYDIGSERIAVALDGAAPATVAPAPPPLPPPPARDDGPGFWSRLGNGLAQAAGNTVDLVKDAASRVDIRGVSAARANAAAQAPVAPRPEPPWGLILGLAAAAVVAFVAWRR